MKKFFMYICVFVFINISIVLAFSEADIIPTDAGSISAIKVEEGTSQLNSLLSFVKDSVFGLLGLVAIGMFLYVGFNLIKAQGNPEEMKKAFMTLIHVIVGLFIVALSWALIKMVSGLII